MNDMANQSFRARLSMLAAGGAVICGFALWPLLGHMAAYLALILCLVALIASWQRQRVLTIARTPWALALLAAFLLIALALLAQTDRSGLPFLADFLVFALGPLLAAALAPIARRQLTLERVSQLCLLAAGLAAAVGLYGMTQGINRPTAPGFSPIHFADLAVVLGFMGLAGTFLGKGRRGWVFYAGPLLAILATIAAETRGGLIVALGLALLYGVVWVWGSAVPRLAKFLLPLGLGVVVIAGFALAYGLGFTRPLEAFEPILALLRGELPSDTSALYRVDMYQAGLRAVLDAPLFGHGWHRQIAAAMPYLTPVGQEGYALEGWGYIHNDALSLAVATGLCGLVAYCLALAAPVLACLASPRLAERRARLYFALCLSLGLFLSGATDVLFMVEVPKLLLVLGTATLYWFGAEDAEETGS